MRHLALLVGTAALFVGCSPADPLMPVDAGASGPMVDAMPTDVEPRDAAESNDGDSTQPRADAQTPIDAGETVDAGADHTDAGGPLTPCGDALCSVDQTCTQCAGERICAGTLYGSACGTLEGDPDNCACMPGLECNDLSLRCTPCVSSGQCNGDERCLKGPGVCAPRVPISGMNTVLVEVIECAALAENETPQGCAQLDTSMGLSVDGAAVDVLEPLAREVGCAGVEGLSEAQNLALRPLLGCDDAPAELRWQVAVPAESSKAGCIYTLPPRLSGADMALVVVDECETPPAFSE